MARFSRFDLMGENTVPALAQQGAGAGSSHAAGPGEDVAIFFFDSFDPGYNMVVMLIMG
jgi:hypothetical protein